MINLRKKERSAGSLVSIGNKAASVLLKNEVLMFTAKNSFLFV